MTAFERRLISARARVLAPVALAGASLAHRRFAGAQDEESRQERSSADPFASMLALVPAAFSGFAESDVQVMFADIAAQLAIAGIEAPNSLEGDDELVRLWINAVYPLAIASPFGSSASLLDRSLIGFDATDLDQTLEFGTPPGIATLLKGRFDQELVEAAWAANGYNPIEVEGQPAASLHEDAKIDLESDLGRVALTRMNNAAFLPDGTLAYAPTLPLLTEIIQAANGSSASFGSRVDVAEMLEAGGDPLASAILVPGASLSIAALVPPDLSAQPAALEELLGQLAEPAMPAVALGLVGITPGGPTILPTGDDPPVLDLPAGSIVFRLLMVAPGTAATAAATIEGRLQSMASVVTGRPYADLFASWTFEPNEDGTVLAIELAPANDVTIAIWSRMLFQRDMLFLAW